MTVTLDEAAVIALVETAYDGRLDAKDWPQAFLSSLHRAVPGSRGGGWFQFDSSQVEGGLKIDAMHDAVTVGEVASFDEWAVANSALPPAVLEAGFGKTGGGTASHVTGLGATLPTLPYWQQVWTPVVKDSLGIMVRDPDGSGAIACAGLPEVSVLGEREQKTLDRVATHLAAALRLRRSAVTAEAAEAVLSADGKVLHATPPAQAKSAAIGLSHERREFARKNTDDSDAALEAWLGLSTGRWSIVDHWDTDGKRLVLAMRNAPRVPPRATLTARERRVVALAAMGHGDKQIAYILGLSIASVTKALGVARKKLGVTNRVELVAAWRAGEIGNDE